MNHNPEHGSGTTPPRKKLDPLPYADFSAIERAAAAESYTQMIGDVLAMPKTKSPRELRYRAEMIRRCEYYLENYLGDPPAHKLQEHPDFFDEPAELQLKDSDFLLNDLDFKLEEIADFKIEEIKDWKLDE